MPTTPAPRAHRATGVRQGVAGAVCGVGAVAAHQTAGGHVTGLAAVLTLAVSVALAPLLLDRAPDPARTLALSLVAQVVWHTAFTASAGSDSMTHHVDTSTMVLHHVVAAVVAAVVAVGAERTVAGAVDWLVGVVLPALARAAALPVRPRPVPAYAALVRVPDDDPHDPARPRRAPPGVLALG